MNKDNKNELFPWVDNEGNVIGHILRGEAHNGSKKLHPVVHLHVFNSQGELYLQKRPQWKDIQPGNGTRLVADISTMARMLSKP